jgi:hypothetical protein
MLITDMQSVVGLAPNSPFWEGVNNSLFLTKGIFAMRITYYPKHETIKAIARFDKDEMMIEIPPENDKFSFTSDINIMSGKPNDVFDSKIICVDNSKDNLIFETNNEIYNKLMDALCVDTASCNREDDLKDFDPNSIIIKITAQARLIHSPQKTSGEKGTKEFLFDYCVINL